LFWTIPPYWTLAQWGVISLANGSCRKTAQLIFFFSSSVCFEQNLSGSEWSSRLHSMARYFVLTFFCFDLCFSRATVKRWPLVWRALFPSGRRGDFVLLLKVRLISLFAIATLPVGNELAPNLPSPSSTFERTLLPASPFFGTNWIFSAAVLGLLLVLPVSFYDCRPFGFPLPLPASGALLYPSSLRSQPQDLFGKSLFCCFGDSWEDMFFPPPLLKVRIRPRFLFALAHK